MRVHGGIVLNLLERNYWSSHTPLQHNLSNARMVAQCGVLKDRPIFDFMMWALAQNLARGGWEARDRITNLRGGGGEGLIAAIITHTHAAAALGKSCANRKNLWMNDRLKTSDDD